MSSSPIAGDKYPETVNCSGIIPEVPLVGNGSLLVVTLSEREPDHAFVRPSVLHVR